MTDLVRSDRREVNVSSTVHAAPTSSFPIDSNTSVDVEFRWNHLETATPEIKDRKNSLTFFSDPWRNDLSTGILPTTSLIPSWHLKITNERSRLLCKAFFLLRLFPAWNRTQYERFAFFCSYPINCSLLTTVKHDTFDCTYQLPTSSSFLTVATAERLPGTLLDSSANIYLCLTWGAHTDMSGMIMSDRRRCW